MEALNIHERELPVDASVAGALIDALASKQDRVWPRSCWPNIRLDRPLGVGAAGGHGPIGYVVEEYQPGQRVKFRFTRPRGLDGHHWLELLPQSEQSVILRHTIHMRVSGLALLTWPLIIRPLHDALLEDACAQAQAALGIAPQVRPWSAWVKLLRWLMSGGRARPQVAHSAPSKG